MPQTRTDSSGRRPKKVSEMLKEDFDVRVGLAILQDNFTDITSA